MEMTVSVLRYLVQIWWKIPGSWKQKKKILSCVATPVRDYAERNPHGGYEAVVRRFGTPEQVAESCLSDMDAEELSKHLQINKKVIAILGATALVIVLLWAGVVCVALAEARTNANNTIVDDIEIIERTQVSEGGKE